MRASVKRESLFREAFGYVSVWIVSIVLAFSGQCPFESCVLDSVH